MLVTCLYFRCISGVIVSFCFWTSQTRTWCHWQHFRPLASPKSVLLPLLIPVWNLLISTEGRFVSEAAVWVEVLLLDLFVVARWCEINVPNVAFGSDWAFSSSLTTLWALLSVSASSQCSISAEAESYRWGEIWLTDWFTNSWPAVLYLSLPLFFSVHLLFFIFFFLLNSSLSCSLLSSSSFPYLLPTFPNVSSICIFSFLSSTSSTWIFSFSLFCHSCFLPP